jgi:hypothetical protein
MTRRTIYRALGLWLAGSIAVGMSGILGRLPVPPPPLAVALAVALLLVVRLSRRVREGLWRLGPAPLVAFHLTRIAAGTYFLVLYRRGTLPGEFALVAGWGDIAVGIAAAAVVLLCLPVRTSAQRVGLLVWNTAGLVDILGVLGNGMRLFAGDPAIGQPFASLPLAVLPTFVVPIVITSHLLIFAWYARAGSAERERAR